MFVSVVMQTKLPLITNKPKLVKKTQKNEIVFSKLLLHEYFIIFHLLEGEFELLLFYFFFLKRAFSEVSDILMQITAFLTVLAMFEI